MSLDVLILCTGNSCRSHMAEGILRFFAGDTFEVHSAGSRPAGFVHPIAIEVMNEIGIDIRDHTSKSLDLFLKKNIDTVSTVCDQADQDCPHFERAKDRHHWAFPDPANAIGTPEEVRECFRNVRDQIKNTFCAFAIGYQKGLVARKLIAESF